MNDEEEKYLYGDGDDGPEESELQSVDDMIDEAEADIEPSDYTQHMLLSYLVSNPSLWIKCRPIVKKTYFDREYRPVLDMITKHVDQYGDMPNAVMIHAKTGVKLDTMEDAHKESIVQWFCDSIEEFCRIQAFHDFLVDAADQTETDRSRETLASLFKQAEQVVQISLHRDLGLEIHEKARDVLKESEKFDNISTGLTFLDEAFSGGITLPSFNLVSAASGDGKSIFMQNIAMYGAERGENVIFYSLELEPAIILKRFAAMMTDTNINMIYQNLDTVAYTMRSRRKKDGEIWVKKFPMTNTTVADIASHYMELTMQTGLHFGLVCVDYIDVMYPINTKVDIGNIHQKDKAVAEELNDWTHKQNIICWSASQQTKGAQDEKDARQSGVAGGTPKINTCDNLIIGKRSEEDKEDERWWGHIAKARSSGGTKAKVPLHWNKDTQRMSDGDRDLFEEANPFLFGRKRSEVDKEDTTSDRISKDPLLRGTKLPKKESKPTGRETSGKQTLDRLAKQFGVRND